MTNSIRRVLRNETTFATSTHENAFQWPLFTICPFVGKHENVQSFVDIMDDIKAARDNFK